MSLYYVDTSALAKRYIAETGSSWVRSWIEPVAGNVITICSITPVEMFSLLARRQRDGSITTTNATLLANDFTYHVNGEYLVTPLDADVLLNAQQLVQKHVLRALDSLQLAAALKTSRILSSSLTFVAADHDLLTAAALEGLTVDNPNLYP